jgi:hypothetical protein
MPRGDKRDLGVCFMPGGFQRIDRAYAFRLCVHMLSTAKKGPDISGPFLVFVLP